LRLPGASWIDYETDKANARRLLEITAKCSVEELIRYVYSSRPDWDKARVDLRTQQVMAAPNRLHTDIKGWLQPYLKRTGLLLDLGCGPGTLLAAAAVEGRKGIGIDVSMVWLVVAQRLIAEWGGQPILAAALAEALPLADNSVSSVVSLDVLEHVAEPKSYLSEINRVTEPGGCVALSTPNRYSLAAEPHVSVWGVGWLPRSWQKSYVKWCSGKSYEFTRLLSTWETAQLLRQHTHFQANILVPPVPEEEVAHFSTRRATLARLYNRLVSFNWMRWLFLIIGPFFRVVGRKV
jgi:2-polyprenyl-3-methyl-5-hydroxy-6-metoxy-1,4-benzoquinol methylase